MKLDTLFQSNLVTAQCALPSKKRILEHIAQKVASTLDIDENVVFDALVAREKLGTTGIGNGIALPHCRLAECDKMTAVMLTTEDPIDFDSMDQKPVKLIIALLAPETENEEHLQALSSIAELVQQTEVVENFCAKTNDLALWEALIANI